jgi:hypothetical protein
MKDSERLKAIEAKLDAILKRIPPQCLHPNRTETVEDGRKVTYCPDCGAS